MNDEHRNGRALDISWSEPSGRATGAWQGPSPYAEAEAAAPAVPDQPQPARRISDVWQNPFEDEALGYDQSFLDEPVQAPPVPVAGVRSGASVFRPAQPPASAPDAPSQAALNETSSLPPTPVQSADAPVPPAAPVTPAAPVSAVSAPQGEPQPPQVIAQHTDVPDDAVTIGRSRTNVIVLDDMLVSRRHVIITADEEGLLVRDLGSRNGTFVNGQRIEATHVHEGDRIGIGASTFEVRDGWLVSV